MRRPFFSTVGDERGAILIQVAVAMVGLLSFTAIVADYGVLWTSRRQAQNAADAAALAGAIALLRSPGNYDQARSAAQSVGQLNNVFGLAPNINLGSGDSVDESEDISFPLCPPGTPGAGTKSCIRVNIYRNESRDPLPTFFARLFGQLDQGVKATATAQIGSGNQIQCLLPFAVVDRWADNFDENKDNTFFPYDSLTGTTGWSQNDIFQPTSGDVYIPPYAGNTGQTGWQVDVDYGRQLIMKGGLNTYSSGWAQQIDLPDSTGSKDYKWNIENCNTLPVGIATEAETCNVEDPPNGCISIKTGMAQGPTSSGINFVVDKDPDAQWVPGTGGDPGSVVGGQGMSSPRIRPIVIVDINNYISQGCNGTTCIGKVANIIGFFVEGMCKDVTLDPGYTCPNPKKDVVGRIVTLPGSYATGVGTVDPNAAFVEVVRLVR